MSDQPDNSSANLIGSQRSMKYQNKEPVKNFIPYNDALEKEGIKEKLNLQQKSNEPTKTTTSKQENKNLLKNQSSSETQQQKQQQNKDTPKASSPKEGHIKLQEKTTTPLSSSQKSTYKTQNSSYSSSSSDTSQRQEKKDYVNASLESPVIGTRDNFISRDKKSSTSNKKENISSSKIVDNADKKLNLEDQSKKQKPFDGSDSKDALKKDEIDEIVDNRVQKPWFFQRGYQYVKDMVSHKGDEVKDKVHQMTTSPKDNPHPRHYPDGGDSEAADRAERRNESFKMDGKPITGDEIDKIVDRQLGDENWFSRKWYDAETVVKQNAHDVKGVIDQKMTDVKNYVTKGKELGNPHSDSYPDRPRSSSPRRE